MRKFAGAWRDIAIVQELLAQITWYHHIALLDKVKDPAERECCIYETIRNGWSRNVLVHQIESGLVNRAGNSSQPSICTPYYWPVTQSDRQSPC